MKRLWPRCAEERHDECLSRVPEPPGCGCPCHPLMPDIPNAMRYVPGDEKVLEE